MSAIYVKCGLVRKADMYFWLSRHDKRCGGESLVLRHVPETHVLEVEDEECVAECIATVQNVLSEKQGRWILKASNGNAGEDLVVFDTLAEVQGLLKARVGEIWVMQRYIERPLLLAGRKFHLRVHTLAVGALAVYVHDDIIALKSTAPYADADAKDTWAHLTNHCVQVAHPEYSEASSIVMLDELAAALIEDGMEPAVAQERVEQLLVDVRAVAGGIFEGFQKAPPIAWFPFDICFEVFGIDMMVDEDWHVWLLEVNSGADLETFGSRNVAKCEAFLRDTIEAAVTPRVGATEENAKQTQEKDNGESSNNCTGEEARAPPGPSIRALPEVAGGYHLVYKHDAPFNGQDSLTTFKRVLKVVGKSIGY